MMSSIIAAASVAMNIVLWYLKNRASDESKWWAKSNELREESEKTRDAHIAAIATGNPSSALYNDRLCAAKAVSAHRSLGIQRGYIHS